MATSPLVAQGTLNRLRGSVVIPSFTNLNVTASYLSKRGITLELTDMATQMIDTMTGMVTSPEPYMPADVTISLLKTNGLAAAWITQIQIGSVLGNVTVHTDTAAYPQFDFLNMAVTRIPRVSFAGDEATQDFVIRGYYVINNQLWSLS